MNSKQLLEQANQRVVKINKVMGEVEEFEKVISEALLGDVCFCIGNEAIYLNVLSPEKIKQLDKIVLDTVMVARDEKVIELEQLLGVEKRKPATLNQEFEQAVREMEQQGKPDPETSPEPKQEAKKETTASKEMTVEDVRRMYHDENKSMKDIAEYYGVTKAVVNNFIYINKLARKKVKDDGYMDAQVEQLRKAQTGKERP